MSTKKLVLISIVILLALGPVSQAINDPEGTFKIHSRYLDDTPFDPDIDVLDISDSLYLSVYAEEEFRWGSGFGYHWAITPDFPLATIAGGVKGPDAYEVVFYGSTNSTIGAPPDGQCGRIGYESEPPYYGPGLYMDNFLYTPQSVGEAAVSFWHLPETLGGGHWEPYGIVDSIFITQVPEPMTITLLVLGALLLRRRCVYLKYS